MQKPKARDGGGWAGRKWRLSIPGSRDGIIAKKGSRTHSKNKVVPLSSSLWVHKTIETEIGISSMNNT